MEAGWDARRKHRLSAAHSARYHGYRYWFLSFSPVFMLRKRGDLHVLNLSSAESFWSMDKNCTAATGTSANMDMKGKTGKWVRIRRRWVHWDVWVTETEAPKKHWHLGVQLSPDSPPTDTTSWCVLWTCVDFILVLFFVVHYSNTKKRKWHYPYADSTERMPD